MDINQTPNLLQFFPFLVYLTPIILFWQQSKEICLKIFRVFWKERIIPYDFAFNFYKELSKQSFIIDFDDYKISSITYFSLKHKKHFPMLFKMYDFQILLYKNFIPIFVIGGKDGHTLKIQYLKFTFNFIKFLDKVINSYYQKTLNNDFLLKQEKPNRFMIYTIRGTSLKGMSESKSLENSSSTQKTNSDSNYQSPNYIYEPWRIIENKLPISIGINVNDIAYSQPTEPLKHKYVFTEDGKYVSSVVEKWLNAEQWYQDKGIRYYRAILLNGSPGTGKSTLVLEIAKKLKVPIWIFDIQSFDNQEFEKKIEDLPWESGIILFEDIDSVWEGRENKTKSKYFGGLTFDCFINKLSGVKGIKNKFVVVTTNHMEKLDSALLRPGRIDEKIHLKSLNKEEKTQVAKIILENNQELIDNIVNEGTNDSTAEFENRCVQKALELYWNK